MYHILLRNKVDNIVFDKMVEAPTEDEAVKLARDSIKLLTDRGVKPAVVYKPKDGAEKLWVRIRVPYYKGA